MKAQTNKLTALIILTILLLNSGCKQYTCECVAIDALSGNVSEVSRVPVEGPKPKAKYDCKNLNYSDSWGNKQTCELK